MSTAGAAAAESDQKSSRGGPLTGLRPLLVASLHQDIRLIVPWIAGVSVLAMSSVLAFNILFGEPSTKAGFIASVGANPAFNLIFGPATNLTTVDGFTAWRSLTLGGFFASLMAILVVTRNSRANEDSGQAELIASGVVGRSTRLAVAVAMALIASVAVGVVTAVGLLALGGEALSSISLGATFTASGIMFAAVAAVTAQLASDARSASALAIGTLGAAFLLRGTIDTADPGGTAGWISPLGWTQRVAPGTENNWWPLLASFVLSAVLVVVAFQLQNRRDFGQGLIPSRLGPATGGAVAGIWGFTIRLNRGAIIWWTIGLLVVGGVFGLLSTTMIGLLETNPAIAQLLAGGSASYDALTFGLLITLINLLTLLAAVYGVGIVNRVYTEEVAYRVEPLLAGQLSRNRYLGSNAAVALLGPAAAMLLATVVIGIVAAAANEAVTVGAVIRQGLLAIPPLWLLIGIGLAAVGAKPKVRLVAWLAIVATFGLTLLGPSFRLPDWALGVSPLWHVPNLKSPDPHFGGLMWIVFFAALLLTVAFAGFRRRDII